MMKPAMPYEELSGHDFGTLGLEDYAYVKPVIEEGETLFAICAADGTLLTTVAERELAYATIRQHEMEPASVH